MDDYSNLSGFEDGGDYNGGLFNSTKEKLKAKFTFNKYDRAINYTFIPLIALEKALKPLRAEYLKNTAKYPTGISFDEASRLLGRNADFYTILKQRKKKAMEDFAKNSNSLNELKAELAKENVHLPGENLSAQDQQKIASLPEEGTQLGGRRRKSRKSTRNAKKSRKSRKGSRKARKSRRSRR